MELLLCKSSFYRTVILLWLSVSLTGQAMAAPPVTPQTASPDLGLGPQGQEQKNIIAMQKEAKAREDSLAQSDHESSQSSLSRKSGNTLRANLEKMKRDAGELSDLAKALQEELNKSDEHLLPLGVLDKAGKIEKRRKGLRGLRGVLREYPLECRKDYGGKP
jgi:hypothetical protein